MSRGIAGHSDLPFWLIGTCWEELEGQRLEAGQMGTRREVEVLGAM